MDGNVDLLRETFSDNISRVVAAIERLNALVQAGETAGELSSYFAALEKSAKENRARLSAVLAQLDQRIDEERLVSEKVPGWKATRQTSKLHSRADSCEHCAAAAVEIVALAMQEAERAVVHALLAREEAIAVQVAVPVQVPPR